MLWLVLLSSMSQFDAGVLVLVVVVVRATLLLTLLQLVLHRSLTLANPSPTGWLDSLMLMSSMLLFNAAGVLVALASLLTLQLSLLSSMSSFIAAAVLVVLLSLLTLQQLLLRLILTLANPCPRGWLEERRREQRVFVEIMSLVAFGLHHFMA